MRSRVTSLPILGGIALLAMLSAGTALACESAHTTRTACARTACPHAATAAAFVPLPAIAPAPLPAGFASLPAAVSAPPIVAGLMAYIDPETGLLTGPLSGLVPTQDLFRSQAEPVALTPVTLPDGSLMVDLQGTLQDYLLLRVDPLGHRKFECTEHPLRVLPLAPIPAPDPRPEQ